MDRKVQATLFVFRQVGSSFNLYNVYCPERGPKRHPSCQIIVKSNGVHNPTKHRHLLKDSHTLKPYTKKHPKTPSPSWLSPRDVDESLLQKQRSFRSP